MNRKQTPLTDRMSQFRAANERIAIVPQWVSRLTAHPTEADPYRAVYDSEHDHEPTAADKARRAEMVRNMLSNV